MREQLDRTKLRHVKRQLLDAQAITRMVKAELVERRKWGQVMSNICFNLSQNEAYDPMARQTMKDCRENWDKIPRSSL